MSAVSIVVPDGIDDVRRPSGGNLYDRRACDGLAALGWSVDVRPVAGRWPCADPAARAGLTHVLAALPGNALVLVDALVASAAPDVIAGEVDRLRVVVLVHLPLGVESIDQRARERTMLASVGAVVATSGWTRRWLLEHYELRADRVHVASPGVEPAGLATGTPTGTALLCVAAVSRVKGHDVLQTALASIAALPWRCVCVGSLDVDADLVGRLRADAEQNGIGDRLGFPGPLAGVDLDDAYAAADVLVLASRAETYGMVITEALARGIPVITTSAGGAPDALGRGADGTRPGLLVPPADAPALARALRRWLGDPQERARLGAAARSRRRGLTGWSDTSRRLSHVLAEVGR